MRLIIQENYENISIWSARYIAKTIQEYQPTEQKPFVLGLPTGSTPMGTYGELVKMYNNKEISFKHVVTFNMDEYVGLSSDHPQSYHYFMWENFFKHIDIDQGNVHIPNGSASNIEEECRSYEKAIASYGGINLFLGGIGSDGHIAFNEPFSSLESVTREKTLTHETKVANSRFFGGDVDKVPSTAITVGIKTIMEAEQVVLLVNGHSKARALQALVEGSVNHVWTCSALQTHRKAVVICDEEATVDLKVGTYRYFKEIEKEHLNPASITIK